MADILTRPDAHRPTVDDASHRHGPSSSPSVEDALDKNSIAELSPVQISQMTRDELVRVIQAANMTLLSKDVSEHLEMFDRESLARLVYLARRCCQNQGY